jgi:hypothetical protein
MAAKVKNMNVEAEVMGRLVELKKGYGLRSLNAVISYLLDLVPAQERDLVSQRVELQKEYRKALASCKKLREQVSQPVTVPYETKPVTAPYETKPLVPVKEDPCESMWKTAEPGSEEEAMLRGVMEAHHRLSTIKK